MANLQLKKSTSKSNELDGDSIHLLRNLFFKQRVQERLELGGNLPMIDGYIELLDCDDFMEAKLTVQVKHLTYPPSNRGFFYDIPNSVFAYANLHKGEVVIFIACDTENETFYWRYIDTEAIQEFIDLPKENQQTLRYYFHQSETCNKENLWDTLSVWRKIFDEKMASFNDEKRDAKHFVEVHRAPFSNINTTFYNLPQSHIVRHEVEEMAQWINSPICETQSNLCILQGNAGVGKSVAIRNLIEFLDKQGIKTLCIKADSLNLMSCEMSLDRLIGYVQCLKADQKQLVIVVDQIDALSQYLTNDRKQINLLVTLLSRLKKYKDVKVVVSCRKYDLEYDNALNSLCKNTKIIDIGELSTSDVKQTLNFLNEGIFAQLDSNTLKLLQTAHFLNLFCMIYSRNSTIVNFRNAHHLYDVFWEIMLSNAPEALEPNEIENSLFMLSDWALEQNTLSPKVSLNIKQKIVFDYLASNNAIINNDNCYSFFHQSFYDYTLARHCTQKDSCYFEVLQDKFQGLEIRSTAKAVLDYEREHNLTQYLNELNVIFNSSKIRQHIKLLALSLIAFSEDTYKKEQEIVKAFCEKNSKYLFFFLRCLHNSKWFVLLKPIVFNYLYAICVESKMLYPIAHFLSVASFKYPQEVFGAIDLIKDDCVKKNIIIHILLGHNDYRRKYAKDALLSSNIDSDYFIHALLDALQTSKSFVFTETEKLLHAYFFTRNKQNKQNDTYLLVEELCKKLAVEYPKDYLKIFHRCFIEVINKKSNNNYNIGGITYNEIFGHDMNGYDLELFKQYKSILLKLSIEDNRIKSLVSELLSTNNECAVCTAFEIMALNPLLYNEEIMRILRDTVKMDSYFCRDVEYYFLMFLKSWYLVQGKEIKVFYETLVMNYIGQNEFISDKQRKYGGMIYPFLGYNRWKLISVTIPENINNVTLNRCRQELYRRYYNGPYKLKKPDHSIQMASVCGSSLSREQFSKLSLRNWLNLFALDGHWHHDRRPIDLRANAGQFKECVSANIDKFQPFVFNLFSNTNMDVMYKLAGLKGLLEGGADIITLWSYVKQFMTLDFIRRNPFEFHELMKFYFKSDNVIIDEIIPFLKSAVINTDEDKETNFSVQDSDSQDSKVNHMLSKALNSYQGKCADLIIRLCGIKERKAIGYQLLNGIRNQVTDDIKLLIVHYIFIPQYYDEELTQNTFKLYLENLASEVLYVRPNTFQHYWYYKPEIIQDYIDIIETDVSAHKILAEIYFFGLPINDRGNECKGRLERLLNMNNEDVVADILETCVKNYSDSDYRSFSEYYLKRYANDGREKIIHAYCLYADKLPVDAFDLFLDVYSQFKGNKYRDINSELRYIKKCIIQYPIECLKFIQSQNFDAIDNPDIVNKDIMEVMLMIYKRLSDDNNLKSMNLLMDIFENLIYSGSRYIMDKL